MATVNDTTAVEVENQQPEQGGRGVVKRKPVFVKVGELKPGTNGHTLAVKVLSSTTVLDKKSRNSSSFSSRPGAANTRIAECLIGDETGTILFTARNDQGKPSAVFLDKKRNETWFCKLVNRLLLMDDALGAFFDLMKPGNTVIIRNAKIDMFKGSMRLAVDKWGRIEVTEPASFTVKEDNNLSLVEYELVNVAE
ncbi:Nucleic acid-binding, OB-fold [Cynara cardunculus var. scolymus]|uniref:Nucleic acid-binding, OB-fold n=1 Tax=Cynara cardunculus var. scolymus TaxID=59895 RepID=A0A103XTZ1_CYNCS|nr:Nucleic acid-binding, OB-fold [Cynara cardunculus var. scolymus]